MKKLEKAQKQGSNVPKAKKSATKPSAPARKKKPQEGKIAKLDKILDAIETPKRDVLTELGIEKHLIKTKTLLKARIAHLKKGLKDGVWAGTDLEDKAKERVKWFTQDLEEMDKD